MKRICSLAALLVFVLGFTLSPVLAQYELLLEKKNQTEPDTLGIPDGDTDGDSTDVGDSTQTDTTETARPKPRAVPEVEESTAPNPQLLLAQAHMWMRRLIFRGKLDPTHIGAYTQYQRTAWDEALGSFGPVEARVGVYYLGQTEWLGKDAEWLQVVYETMESDPELIEYDLIVGTQTERMPIYRALYRVDRGELQTLDLGADAEQMDYDAVDRPADDGTESLDIYFGTFDTEKFRGSGGGGAGVVLYRNGDVRPLGLVRLGYGDEALTLTDHGSDARPRFYVPPPPRAQ